jgi:hypothetical protein
MAGLEHTAALRATAARARLRDHDPTARAGAMTDFRNRSGQDDPDDSLDPFTDPGPDDEDALGHGARAGLDDTYVATCPYCFEECELVVDLGGGSEQSYVEDCPVCCRPWQVRVSVDDEGAVSLDLEPLDE